MIISVISYMLVFLIRVEALQKKENDSYSIGIPRDRQNAFLTLPNKTAKSKLNYGLMFLENVKENTFKNTSVQNAKKFWQHLF